MTTDNTLTLPYAKGANFGFFDSDEVRLESVRVLARLNKVNLDEAPAVSLSQPLKAWCWLVLRLNDIEPEYAADGSPRPLTHYGIDCGFASAPVRKYLFWLA